MIRTRDVWITSPTLSPLGYGLSYMMPSIQFFFKNEMSFRLEIGQFVMMLFHLNTIFLVDQYKLSATAKGCRQLESFAKLFQETSF